MNLAVKTTGGASEAVAEHVPQLVSDRVASRIFAKDFTLWGPEAESESSIRLGWVDAAAETMALMPELGLLRDDFRSRGITRVVLCGMGGSSLAPELLAASDGVKLIVLDSTYPSQVRNVVSVNIEHTVVVISSKSGSTVETDSQKRAFEEAFSNAGIKASERIIIVTDPGSPMEAKAKEDGYRVILANPNVGGRYSALTAFGAVPAVLAGVDMQVILQDAINCSALLASDSKENPSLVLGAALAKTLSGNSHKDKFGVVSISKQILGLGNWLEQLIAESTGKLGLGILPVVLEDDAPELASSASDLLLVGIVDDVSVSDFEISVSGTLGQQLVLWEVATAVASRLIGVNPFDQPDVESAKTASREFLEKGAVVKPSLFEDSGVWVSVSNLTVTSEASFSDAVSALLQSVSIDGYFSIHAYLDRARDSDAEALRAVLSRATGRPTTFGWGPRFLHSTGQYHKGGPARGVFLQLIGVGDDDVNVPGRSFSFQELMNSQAAGDANVLALAGRPVLTLRTMDVSKLVSRLSSEIARLKRV